MIANVLVSTGNLPYEDWLEYRKQGIGGSDAAVVCGISRYKSPVELWMEKTGQLPAQETGEAAYWGNLLESLGREEFTKRTGIPVTKPSACLLYTSLHTLSNRIRNVIADAFRICWFEDDVWTSHYPFFE